MLVLRRTDSKSFGKLGSVLPPQRRNSRLEQDPWPGWYNHYEKSHLFNSGQKANYLYENLLCKLSTAVYKDCVWHVCFEKKPTKKSFSLVAFKDRLWLFLRKVWCKIIILANLQIFPQSHAGHEMLSLFSFIQSSKSLHCFWSLNYSILMKDVNSIP